MSIIWYKKEKKKKRKTLFLSCKQARQAQPRMQDLAGKHKLKITAFINVGIKARKTRAETITE